MRPIAILVAVLLLLVAPAAGAQTPVPPATPASSAALVKLTLDELPPGSVATIGIVRTTYEAGGGLRVASGSGPSVQIVESGTLSVRAEGDVQVSVVPGGAPAAPDAAPGADVTVEAGDAFVLPVGAMAELHNTGDSPASTLNLLAAPDATVDAETKVTHAVLVQREATLPDPPVTVTFSRVTLAPGDQLALPAEPAQVAYAAAERSQAFLLSGQGINRGPEPMEVYLLTFASPSV